MAGVKFVIGDKVKLKSDGPWMTVTKDKPEAGPKFIHTSWFDGSQLCSHDFPKDAVELDPAVAKLRAEAAAEKAGKSGGDE